jgi:hypothetical protein
VEEQYMKRAVLITVILIASGALAWAQMGPGMMGQGPGGACGYQGGPGWWGNPACGMMGPGWGGMHGMGGMHGWGMMGSGCGMHGMGGMHGWGFDYSRMREFMDETVELRRKLVLKKFEYFEALRNPDTKRETLRKLQGEMGELWSELYEKATKR